MAEQNHLTILEVSAKLRKYAGWLNDQANSITIGLESDDAMPDIDVIVGVGASAITLTGLCVELELQLQERHDSIKT
jgi:hypothetical protein